VVENAGEIVAKAVRGMAKKCIIKFILVVSILDQKRKHFTFLFKIPF